ncbi:regulator [Vibrio sp. Isolate33]|uniref:regulator n=1 Tax=Vibrio sp. Isolate33 TaxID=2908539 RepID=UPI001EFCA226|nr:regulator [Vibrio sp. Isolate33]
MTKNQLFREFYCRLSLEETAELCFKNVTTVKRWDKGNPIPNECKRLMRLCSYREVGISDDWVGFYVENGKFVLPTGQRLTASQILLGAALLEIGSNEDQKTASSLIRLARCIAKTLNKPTT